MNTRRCSIAVCATVVVLLLGAGFLTTAGDATPGKPTTQNAKPAGKTSPASAQDSATSKQQGSPPVQDPEAPKKAVQELRARREKLEMTLSKVSEKTRDKEKLDLKTEKETLEQYRDVIIPELRNWRRVILEEQGPIMTDVNGYILASESAIEGFRTVVKDGRPALRTQKARQQQNQLDGEKQRIAGILAERHKDAVALAAELTEFVYYVDDSGALLAEWEAIVLGLIETDQKGEAALQRLQGLRAFAKDFEDAFTKFIDAVGKLDYGIPQT